MTEGKQAKPKGKALSTVREVEQAKPGVHSVSGGGVTGGLRLQVTEGGKRSWQVRFTSPTTGKRREMGLGSFPAVSLALARQRAAEAREKVARGVDPIDEREEQDKAAAVPLFSEVAADYLKAHAPKWKTAKQAQVWLNSLTTHAAPIWNKRVDAITRDDVLNLLLPIWHTKPETGNRVRMRIADVLGAAIVRGLRPAPNPAAWGDEGLKRLLPSWKAVHTVEHHAALDWKQAPKLYKELRGRLHLSALALEWTLLTACRVGEAVGAEWKEIDLQAAVWTVPASRMKMAKPHRAPLTPRLLAILEALPRQNAFLFPGGTAGHLNAESVRRCLQRDLGEPELTVHGLRSTFRQWAADSSYAFDLAEQQLAHQVGDETVRAYLRGDALEGRRPMMEAWAAFLASGLG